MSELDWLVTYEFEGLIRREYDWVFAFGKKTTLTVECLWRLVEGDRIRFTSLDDGHRFGHPAPVDLVVEVNSRLAHATVKAVELKHCLLDMEIRFSTGHALQVIPNSSGYEAWQMCPENAQYIAVGGGDLVIYRQ